DRVRQWVRDNRDADQEPILLGETEIAGNVDLVKIEQVYTEPRPEEAPGVAVSTDALESAWKRWDALRRAVPSPATYSPHIWRQYQDTLLRYEQVVRAGDPTGKAGSLQGALAALDKDMVRSRVLNLGCAGNALPLPMAMGQPPLSSSAEFKGLWDE